MLLLCLLLFSSCLYCMDDPSVDDDSQNDSSILFPKKKSIHKPNQNKKSKEGRKILICSVFMHNFEKDSAEFDELIREQYKSAEKNIEERESPNDYLKLQEAIVQHKPDEQLSNFPAPEPTRWFDYKYADYGFPD